MTDDVLEDSVVLGEVVDATALPDIDLPDDPAEAVVVLRRALAEARANEAAHTEDLQRIAADFENFRKRVGRDQQDMVGRASQRLVEALLPVLDSFDGAFTTEAQTPGEEAILSGVRSTYHLLRETLEREGLALIAAEAGDSFDPEVHEAVAGGGGDDLRITSVMRRGYTLGERVLRPALVAVAPAHEQEEAGSE